MAEQLKDKAKEVAERVKPDFVPDVNKVRSLQLVVATLLRAHVATYAWVQLPATHGQRCWQYRGTVSRLLAAVDISCTA